MSEIDDLLRALHERGGSDLHLLEGTPPKARIHGRLDLFVDPPQLLHQFFINMQPAGCINDQRIEPLFLSCNQGLFAYINRILTCLGRMNRNPDVLA